MKQVPIKNKLVKWACVIDSNYEELEYLQDKAVEDESLTQCVHTLIELFVHTVKTGLHIDEGELMVMEWLKRRKTPMGLPILEAMEDDSAETFVNTLFDYYYYTQNNSEFTGWTL